MTIFHRAARKALIATSTLATMATLFATTVAYAEVKINPGPIAGAVAVKENARGTVWCEIIPLVGTPPKQLFHIYTSTFTDDCTEERAAKLDLVALAAELKVPKVALNPGRYWVFDRATIYAGGEIVDFQGIKVQWAATMTPEAVAGQLGGKPFTPGAITRDTEWFYSKGKPAYLLRTPEGKVWVLQVISKAKDPSMSMETLDQLGSKLQLPEGWTFEKKVLDKDLSLQPRWSNGDAYIMRDNLGNTYMGCGYDKSCSYLP